MPVQITNQAIDAFYDDFRKDVIVFEQKLPEMLREYPGEYVAIFQGQIIGHREDWDDLVKETRENHPNEFVFIEHVACKPEAAIDVDSLDN